VVAFDFFGTLNPSDLELNAWLQDPSHDPPVRAGAVEVANVYRDHGYEVLYVTTAPAILKVGDRPVLDVVTDWLDNHGFPMGPGTRIWTWDGQGDTPVIGIVDELIRLSNEGVSIDAGYTDNEDKARSMASGGIEPASIYTLGAGAGTGGSTAIPNDDLMAHLMSLQQSLPQVCTPG